MQASGESSVDSHVGKPVRGRADESVNIYPRRILSTVLASAAAFQQILFHVESLFLRPVFNLASGFSSRLYQQPKKKYSVITY